MSRRARLVLAENLTQHPKPRRQIPTLVTTEIANHLTNKLSLRLTQMERRV
jgi:hypothetical protein